MQRRRKMGQKTKKSNGAGRRIEFRVEVLSAQNVSLAGSFNDWQPDAHPMDKDETGLWKRTLLLAPGQYEYRIYADGQWLNDPNNPLTCPNCFSTENNVLVVR
jgi:1,4-alpha-glucan branching enzyme